MINKELISIAENIGKVHRALALIASKLSVIGSVNLIAALYVPAR